MRTLDSWPAYVAGLCALFVGLGWLLRHNLLGSIYGTPLRYTGLALVALPLLGVLVYRDPVIAAITYAIAGIIFAAEAVLRRILVMAYLSAGAFIVVIWAVLMALEVSELLAYVTPLSLGLLGLGWSERIQGRITSYMLPTMAGLVTLMGATFYQSVVYPPELLLVAAPAGERAGYRLGNDETSPLLYPGGRSGHRSQRPLPTHPPLLAAGSLDTDRRNRWVALGGRTSGSL